MKKMFKLAAVLMALVMALALVACGGGGESDDPNAGKYLGDQINMLGWQPITEVYSEGENYVELNGGGKGTFCIDGDPLSIKWEIQGENLTMTADDQVCKATVKDGVIVTADFFGFDMQMTFVKEGVTPPVMEGATLDENVDQIVDETVDELLEEDSAE